MTPLFYKRETEAQKGEVTCSKSPKQAMAGSGVAVTWILNGGLFTSQLAQGEIIRKSLWERQHFKEQDGARAHLGE